MGSVSTSFANAIVDLRTWMQEAADIQAQTKAAGDPAEGRMVAISPVMLDSGTVERGEGTRTLSALAHLCVSFGQEDPLEAADAYDRLFFALMTTEAFARSRHKLATTYWHQPPGLVIAVERRLEKPIVQPVTRPVTEPLVFDVHDLTRPNPAKGN